MPAEQKPQRDRLLCHAGSISAFLDRGPSRYDIVLEPDLESSTFAGKVDVAVERARARSTEIVLNALELEVDGAWLRQRRRRRESRRAEIALDDELQRATLPLGAAAEPGSWTLGMSFRGVLNDQLHGFYRSTYTDDDGTHTIATTQFEAADARRAFPCWDEPDLKAVFGITLVVPDDVVALSNGPEVERDPADDGRVRVRFADTMAMSTYLVAFVDRALGDHGPRRRRRRAAAHRAPARQGSPRELRA